LLIKQTKEKIQSAEVPVQTPADCSQWSLRILASDCYRLLYSCWEDEENRCQQTVLKWDPVRKLFYL